MDNPTPPQATSKPARDLVVDGPPVWVVTIIFAGLLAISWGRGDPGAGLGVFALGMVVALGANASLAGAQRRGGATGALRFTGPPRSPPPARPRRVL